MSDKKHLCVAIQPAGEDAQLIVRADDADDHRNLGEIIAMEVEAWDDFDDEGYIRCSAKYLTEKEIDDLPEFEGW